MAKAKVEVAGPKTKVEFPKILYEKALIPIVGTKPLLVNRLPYIAKGQKLPEMNDEERFETSLYHMSPHKEDGSPRYGFPAAGIKIACINAGRFIPGLPMTEIRGMFYVNDEEDGLLPIIDPNDPDRTHSPVPVIDRQMAKTKNGVAVSVVRARFDEWMFPVPVDYSRTFTSLEQITGILNVAGALVGLGCRRPERSGLKSWGTFDVAS